MGLYRSVSQQNQPSYSSDHKTGVIYITINSVIIVKKVEEILGQWRDQGRFQIRKFLMGMDGVFIFVSSNSDKSTFNERILMSLTADLIKELSNLCNPLLRGKGEYQEPLFFAGKGVVPVERAAESSGVFYEKVSQAYYEAVSQKEAISHGATISGEIIAPVEQVTEDTVVSDVDTIFKQNKSDSFVIVVKENKPTGMISKIKLYQLLGTRYGVSLYMNKPVKEIMDPEILIVNENLPLQQVSNLAMARDPRQLYDAVVVMGKEGVKGIITIQSLLDTITKIQIELARDMNPLTFLPGNRLIEEELRNWMTGEELFSLIYADLDFFKWYNDQFGFKNGDRIIQFLASILLDLKSMKNVFVGHIGGDDFILTVKSEEAEVYCNYIIERFESDIKQFYPDYLVQELAHNGFIEVKDRNGNPMKSTGISLSLIILDSNNLRTYDLNVISEQVSQLKKEAKSIVGSTFVRGVL